MGTVGSIREREACFNARGLIDTTLLSKIHKDLYEVINWYSWPRPQLKKNLTYLFSFPVEGGTKADPLSLAVNRANGNIYVSDGAQHIVSIHNSKGQLIKTFGSKGAQKGQFMTPCGLALSSRGDVLVVVETGNARIQLFDANGKFLSSFGSKGSKPGQFSSPRGVTVDANDLIYVADRVADMIQVFTLGGVFLRQITDFISPPLAVVLNHSGQLFVAEAGAAITCLDNDGNCLRRYKAPIHFNPSGIMVDGENKVLVADSAQHRVIVLSPELQDLNQHGLFGSHEGRFKNPCDVEMSNDGCLVVLDKGNVRVQVWG